LAAREQKRGVWNEKQFPRGPGDTSGIAPIAAGPRVVSAASPLDLNTATFEELQELPGIGPKLAERILAHRPYKKVEDLDDVPGIGQRTLEKLTPLIQVKPTHP
jgi:competence protein ComEA